jgi:hypothetical protein
MKHLIQLVVLTMTLAGYAQKQGNQWYFGTQAGLNFNTGIPVPQAGGQTGTDAPLGIVQEGTSSISDSSGALLFYSGGKTIWNRFHQVMPNGTNIMGGVSSTQAALIVPKPANDSLFYLFTSDEWQNNGNNGYRYTLVNMCQDNQKGDVVISEKNVLLMGPSTEKLAACRDQAGTGYWVVGHKLFSNQFSAWHLTPGGITNTVTTLIGAMHGFNPNGSNGPGTALGQMKISPQANKIAVAVGNYNPGFVELGNFNNATGVVSNICHLNIDSAIAGTAVYGVEFSPNGSKLYVSAAGGPGIRIYQFDLQAGGGSCAAILGSQALVTQTSQSGLNMGLQLGPDNKIYSVYSSYYDLACINAPNLSAASCGFTTVGVPSLPYHYSTPSFVAGYNYSNNSVQCNQVTSTRHSASGPDGQNISIFPNPVTNKLTLELPDLTAFDYHLSIQNAFGQIIYTSTLLTTKQEIDMTAFEKGIYFLFIEGGAQQSAIKIIKD